MRIRSVALDPGIPWLVDHDHEVVFLSTLLPPHDAPRHLRDALDELYPRETVRLALVK